MADETKSLTEEQMLDYFQKEGIAHEQRGGKLFVGDVSTLPGKYRAYFNGEGFFADAGKRSVAAEVKETIAEEGLSGNPAEGDEPADDSKVGTEPTAEAKAPAKATPKSSTKKAATKTAAKKGK